MVNIYTRIALRLLNGSYEKGFHRALRSAQRRPGPQKVQSIFKVMFIALEDANQKQVKNNIGSRLITYKVFTSLSWRTVPDRHMLSISPYAYTSFTMHFVVSRTALAFYITTPCKNQMCSRQKSATSIGHSLIHPT